MNRINTCRRWAVAFALLAAVIAGCDAIGMIGGPRGGPYPEACAQWGYGPNQCEGIVERAIASADIDEADVMSITLLPFDPHVNLGGRQVGLVRLELSSGDFVDEAVLCVGVSVNRACVESVAIQLGGIGVDRDVPCAGEPPAGCATLPPTPEPAAIAASRPFSLASLDIAIDRKGRYEVELGTASLPDGYLSDRSFSLANPAPEDFWIDDGVLLQVRPDLSGRPPVGSVYRDPYDGPEPVTIFMVFTVTDLDAPSVLQVRDVIVR